jgi:hypothetical protein
MRHIVAVLLLILVVSLVSTLPKEDVRKTLPGADDPARQTFLGGFWNGVTFGLLEDDE